jgi:hypothetical protein
VRLGVPSPTGDPDHDPSNDGKETLFRSVHETFTASSPNGHAARRVLTFDREY